MSKTKEDVATPGLPPKVLRASDPATLKLIHEYLDQNKGKLPDGKSITKLRRYMRKPNKPEKAGEHIYAFKNQKGETVQIALDESVIIFNAEEPQKRRLRIIKTKIAEGVSGRVKNVAKEPEVEFATIDPATGRDRVLKIVAFTDKFDQFKPRPLRRMAIRGAKSEKKLGGSEGYVIRELGGGGKLYIDLPKYPGKELFEYQHKISDFDEKLQITIETLEQLKDRFHNHGYLHRDLKPENIIYDQGKKELHIIDLDTVEKAAKPAEETQISRYGVLFHKGTILVGTPGYAAPEILKKKEYSEKTDVYAVGVMCAGFLGLSAYLTYTFTPERDFDDIIPSKLGSYEQDVEKTKLGAKESETLKNVLLEMTNKDPTKRIGVQEALKTLHEIKKVRQERISATKEMDASVKTAIANKEETNHTKVITPQMRAATVKSSSDPRKTSSDKENTTPPPTSKPSDPGKF